MGNPLRLGYSGLDNTFYVGKMKEKGGILVATGKKTDVTLDATRAMVRFLYGDQEDGVAAMQFKVDGMTFRTTIERIK